MTDLRTYSKPVIQWNPKFFHDCWPAFPFSLLSCLVCNMFFLFASTQKMLQTGNLKSSNDHLFCNIKAYSSDSLWIASSKRYNHLVSICSCDYKVMHSVLDRLVSLIILLPWGLHSKEYSKFLLRFLLRHERTHQNRFEVKFVTYENLGKNFV